MALSVCLDVLNLGPVPHHHPKPLPFAVCGYGVVLGLLGTRVVCSLLLCMPAGPAAGGAALQGRPAQRVGLQQHWQRGHGLQAVPGGHCSWPQTRLATS